MHDFYILDNGSPGPPAGADRESFIDMLAVVFQLNSIALPHAQADDFPVRMSTESSLTQFSDLATFMAYASGELERVTIWLASAKQGVDNVRRLAGQLFSKFAREVGDFLDRSEAIVLANGAEDAGQDRLSLTLERMKRVGAQAEELRTLVSGRALNALSRVMRALIDGPYLLLTQMHCGHHQWSKSRESVVAPLRELANLLQRE